MDVVLELEFGDGVFSQSILNEFWEEMCENILGQLRLVALLLVQEALLSDLYELLYDLFAFPVYLLPV